MTTKLHPCFKCNGSGTVSFRHIENGVCFTCGGTGKISYTLRPTAFPEPHPELVVPETKRSTLKQWDFLGKLCGDSDSRCRAALLKVGAKIANQRYVSKTIMSLAIDAAKAEGLA